MSIIVDKVNYVYSQGTAYEIQALKNINLDIPEKEITAFIGPSGCGKSTLLKSLNRMNDLVEGCKITGEVTLDGVDIYKNMDVTLLRKRVGMVFQSFNLFPQYTALENVTLALPGRNRQNRERAADWLRLMGLEEEVDSLPFTLSGGMQRRVAIARALAAEGDVLLLDEPFTGLDDGRRRDIVTMIRKAYAERLVVLVTHSEEEWRELNASCLRLPQTPLSGPYAFPKQG